MIGTDNVLEWVISLTRMTGVVDQVIESESVQPATPGSLIAVVHPIDVLPARKTSGQATTSVVIGVAVHLAIQAPSTPLSPIDRRLTRAVDKFLELANADIEGSDDPAGWTDLYGIEGRSMTVTFGWIPTENGVLFRSAEIVIPVIVPNAYTQSL